MSEFNTNNPRPLRHSFYPEGSSGKTIQVSAEVVFGSPSKNCDGYGVCMLTSRKDTLIKKSRCPVTLCDAFFFKDTQELILRIEKKYLSELVSAKFLEVSQSFLMEEAYRLSPIFLRKGGMDGPWVIRAGNHRIQEQKTYWEIRLSINRVEPFSNRGLRVALEALRDFNKKMD